MSISSKGAGQKCTESSCGQAPCGHSGVDVERAVGSQCWRVTEVGASRSLSPTRAERKGAAGMPGPPFMPMSTSYNHKQMWPCLALRMLVRGADLVGVVEGGGGGWGGGDHGLKAGPVSRILSLSRHKTREGLFRRLAHLRL